MRADIVHRINADICVGKRTRREKHRKMPSGRHSHSADVIRTEAEFFRPRADEPHRPLAVLPGSPVEFQSIRPRRTVDKRHTPHAQRRVATLPLFYESDIIPAVVSSAGYENDARIAAVGRRSIVPLKIRTAVTVRIESLGRSDIKRRSDLMRLRVRHTAFRPQILPFVRRQPDKRKKDQNKTQAFHRMGASNLI